MDWQRTAQEELSNIESAGLYRRRRIITPIDSTHVEIDGRQLINFASNDYLGLTHHPAVIEAAVAATRRYGAGSGAAPLVSGYGPAHASAEEAIARWKNTESAILFPSGYQANLAAVQTFSAIGHACGKVRFLIDKLAHASLVDAVRNTGDPFRVFPHNHLGKLRRLLSASEPGQLQVVVSESIFSMDGDAADLNGLAELKQQFPFALLLDEAHASGVYGEHGSGYASECGLQKIADVSVVTLSKALGGGGGAVCASSVFGEALINLARPYLFSTMLPASSAASAEAAIDVLRAESQRQQRVRALAREVRASLAGCGMRLAAGDSPIIPVLLGDEKRAVAAATELESRGFLVVAIRPTTVPRGTSRLRVTLSCDHTDREVDDLLRAIQSLPQQVFAARA